jgi:hypothetical protein
MLTHAAPATAAGLPSTTVGGDEADEGEEVAGEPAAKRRRRAYDPSKPEVQGGAGQQLVTGAVKQQLLQVVPSVLDGSATVEDVSHGQHRHVPGGLGPAGAAGLLQLLGPAGAAAAAGAAGAAGLLQLLGLLGCCSCGLQELQGLGCMRSCMAGG